MGRDSILVLAVSGMAVCGALATGPALAFAAASAAARPAAPAAGPRWGTAQGLPGIAALEDGGVAADSATLSCSSPRNCAVGGSYSGLAGSGSSAFVADQRNGTLGRAIEVPGLAALNVGGDAVLDSLSCTSAGDCTAGGSYSPGGADAGRAAPALDAFVVTETNGTWGRAIEVPGTAALNVGGSAGVSSVSCWSPGDCVAAGQYAPGGVTYQTVADTQAFVVTETNGTWGRAMGLPGLAALNTGEMAVANSISCTAGGNCAVGGDYTTAPSSTTAPGQVQAFVADESAGAWQPAEEVPGTAVLNVYGVAGVYDVSCASPGNCGAIGGVAGNSAETFVASEINGTWRTADALPGGVNADAISCASSGNCVAGGIYYNGGGEFQLYSQAFILTELNSTWGSPQPVPGLAGLNIGQAAEIESVSCSAPGDCGAGGYYAGTKSDEDQPDQPLTEAPAQAFVVTETDGTWGRAEEVPGISALTATDAAEVDAVSCVSPQACTATGRYSASDTSAAENVFVVSTEAPTATTESLSAAKVTYGREQTERVSAAVTAKTGGPWAGKVTVKAGSAKLCVITLRSGRGACTLTARRLGPGTYRLTAAYPGSPDFAPSVSRIQTLTVVK